MRNFVIFSITTTLRVIGFFTQKIYEVLYTVLNLKHIIPKMLKVNTFIRNHIDVLFACGTSRPVTLCKLRPSVAGHYTHCEPAAELACSRRTATFRITVTFRITLFSHRYLDVTCIHLRIKSRCIESRSHLCPPPMSILKVTPIDVSKPKRKGKVSRP